MKRILSVLLVLVFVLACAVPTFAASADFIVSTDKKEVKVGDEVTFTIKLDTFLPVKAIGLKGLRYDKTVFSLVSGEWKLSGADIVDFSTKTGDGVIGFYEAQKSVSNPIFTFVLKAEKAADKIDVSADFVLEGREDRISGVSVTAASVKVVEGCQHKLGDWVTDETRHWKVCSKCSEKLERAKHTFKDDVCTVCKYEKPAEEPEVHEHDLALGYMFDEEEHWQVCNDCEEHVEATAHTYDDNCATTCTTCDYVRVAPHSYALWSGDEQNHSRTCTICQFTDNTAHTFETADGKTACTLCGYEKDASGAHVHSYLNYWVSDDLNHWRVCPCGEMGDVANHDWQEDGDDTHRCSVCSRSISGDVPTITPQKGGNGWVIWLIVGILLVSVAVGFVVVVLLNNKKNSKPKRRYL